MARHTVAIGGGKGGVGKSLVAANLAIATAQRGYRVALVDADLGGANQHTLFGIDRPRVLLEHFLEREIQTLNQALLPTAQAGLKLICGGMPVLGTANPNYAQKLRLIRHIHALDVDVALIDIGAGVSYNVLDLFNAAEHKLVVISPQLTSLHNGYGFLKAAIHRRLQRTLDHEVRGQLDSTPPEQGGESLNKVIDRISIIDTEEGEKAALILQQIRLSLVGNMLRGSKDQHVIQAISSMITDHLGLEAPVLGNIPYSEAMERSVNERRPFMLSAGVDPIAENFRALANKLVNTLIAIDQQDHRRKSLPMPTTGRYERLEPRFPIRSIPASLATNGLTIAGYVQDLAHGGILLEFTSPVAQAPSDGVLTVGPLSDGKLFSLSVAERHRDRSGTRIGFAFVDLAPHLERELEQIVAEATANTAVRPLPS
jgi:flagellar biosynthesis protein FlhG